MDFIPEFTSELEHDYPILKETQSFLNVYGSSGCGKTTIVKTYMKSKNYHYIDDYNMSMDNFIEFIKKITRVDVMSYFMNNLENTTLVIDNYDYFNFKYKTIKSYIENFNIIIISNVKYFEKSIYIPPPSDEYLFGLMYSINYLNNTPYHDINTEGSFLKFFSSINHGTHIKFDNFYSELDCLSNIYDTKDINITVYDINAVHQSYVYHLNNIDRCAYMTDIISDSIYFNGTEYYQCMSNMVIYNLDSKITTIKNFNVNYHTRAKVYNDCKKLNCDPLELSLIKKIKK